MLAHVQELILSYQIGLQLHNRLVVVGVIEVEVMVAVQVEVQVGAEGEAGAMDEAG